MRKATRNSPSDDQEVSAMEGSLDRLSRPKATGMQYSRSGLRGRHVLDVGRIALLDVQGLLRAAGPTVTALYLKTALTNLRAVSAHLSLLPVDASMPPRQYTFTPFPGRPGVTVDTAGEGERPVFAGAREMYCRKVYFTNSEFRINPGDRVLDLGANIGLFTTLAAVVGARVVSVEAQDGFLPLIKRNLERNGVVDRVQLYHGLVGGSRGIFAHDHSGASHWHEDPPRLTMDQLLERAGFDTVDFLKMDIEGSEFDLLEGEPSWLSRINKIAMEVHREFGDPNKIVNVLRREQFRTQLVNNSSKVVETITEDTAFIFAWRSSDSSAQRPRSMTKDGRAKLYPEAAIGGFTHVDGTVEFYSRVNSLLRDDMTVLDLGAGRGAWLSGDAAPYRRQLRNIRPRVDTVIGLDVDPAILMNQSVDKALLIEPSGDFPLPSESIDLVICDAVFEHVVDPLKFASEIARVTKRGGWLCARTPNRWGYPALAARLVPNELHTSVLRTLQPHRKEKDVFPTKFLLNSRRQLDQMFPDRIWNSTVYYASGEPAYAGSSAIAWQALDLLHRILPRRLQTSLFIFSRRLP